MKGDFSRFSYDPSKHYTGVLKQQGRVDLDADWNEHLEIQDHLRRTMEMDLMGGSGVPDRAGGFSIGWDDDQKDLTISPDDPNSPGRMYVEGILCELEGKVYYKDQPDYPDPPTPDAKPGQIDLVYLDVWQRHVTAAEDSDIQEEALGGPDTTTRLQTVWQVQVQKTKLNSLPTKYKPELLTGEWPPAELGGGRLSTRGNYRGSENRLYRVEIHEGGKADPDSDDCATFKWSRDNGAIVFPIDQESLPTNEVRVSRLGRDQVLTLHGGDWVEVAGDDAELRGEPGLIAKIRSDGIDRARRKITLESDVSGKVRQRHPKVRRWDQTGAGRCVLKEGACKVEEGSCDPEGTWLELEDGVEICFEPGHVYRTGDYWVFAARAATGKVEQLEKTPPRGVRHCYGMLALVKWSADANGTPTIKEGDVFDCRRSFGSHISGSWLLTGNSATNPANDFLGTVDNQPLAIRTNDLERMRVTADGNVGIGTNPQPGDKLDVQGNVRINDHDLMLRTGSDSNDGIGWHGTNKPFAGTQVDGPVLFGHGGGALGSTYGDQKLALRWDASRNVRIGMAPAIPPNFATKWGTVGAGEAELKYPGKVAVDAQGNVYVADAYNNRVQKFAPNGTFLARWGSPGNGDGQFSLPWGLAVDASGNVYVADRSNNRVQKFTPNGTFIAKWGSPGNGDGQFSGPEGVAVDPSGNVYVTDAFNHRVQKFTPNGAFIAKWGGQGTGNGQFSYPGGVAVDSSGNVCVADSGNSRIQKFDSNGAFIAKWGGQGTGDGQFDFARAVAVDASGNVYVADPGNRRVQKFASSGTFIAKWGSYGRGDGRFFEPDGVAVDASGNVYVADRCNNRIQKFDSNGAFITKWGSPGNGDGQFVYPSDVAVDASGNVYVTDENMSRIEKFDSNGAFITKWGNYGQGDGQFVYPSGVAVDASGNVYVADPGNNRVQKFDSNGAFAAKWGSQGAGNGQFSYPGGVAVDPSGNVYVADTYNSRIQKFTSNGAFIAKWGSPGNGDGQFSGPQGVAVDSSGNVYVGDWNGRIQKFNSNGAFITKWGSYGQGDGQFVAPEGVVVDASGNVYVADRSNDHVQKFAPDGRLLTKWGSYGAGDGRFFEPDGVAVDASGNVYVADTSNNRVQKFAPDGRFIAKWG